MIFRQVCCFNLQQGPVVVKLDSTKAGEIDTPHLKEICPRGNNKVLYISLYHDKCLLFMLELY